MSGKIKRIFIFIFLFFSGLNLSCDKTGLTIDCSKCYTTEPDSGYLRIYITLNEKYHEVPLIVYWDQIDDNRIEYIDTATTNPYKLFVEIKKYYSVKAEYESDEKTIFVVDGDKLKTNYITESCDEECWVITGGRINARLKFD